MNELHLTTEQLDALLVGETRPEATRHLDACDACATELATMRESITLLSGAVTGLARHDRFHFTTATTLLAQSNERPSRPIFRLTATLALAASVAIVAAVAPVRHLVHPLATPVAAPAQTQQSDEALLNEIDQQLSASVPQALQPLQDPTATHSQSNKQN